MGVFVMRVWLPDRPGALGAVASRIGAVRGDLVGIDILERGAGRAIDELVIELPDDALVPLSSAATLTSDAAPDDVGWAHLAGADVALLLGRDGRPLRARERRQLTVLADIADHRWAEVAARSARMRHPANT